MLAVSHNGNPSVNDIKRWNTEKKNLNNFLNQIANMKKRERLATFAKGIVDNLWRILQQNKWNTIEIRLPRLIINAPYGSNFKTIPDVFVSGWKKLAVVERLFWQLRTRCCGCCRCRGVGCCGELAEVRMYHCGEVEDVRQYYYSESPHYH